MAVPREVAIQSQLRRRVRALTQAALQESSVLQLMQQFSQEPTEYVELWPSDLQMEITVNVFLY